MNTKTLTIAAGTFGLIFLPGCANNCFDDGLLQTADAGCPVVTGGGTDDDGATAADTAADSSGGGGSCSNGVQDGDETDVDCGGSCDEQCGSGQGCESNEDCQTEWCGDGMTCTDPTCTDGFENGDETDVDCGGSCEPCPDGDGCQDGEDCQSGQCNDDGTCDGSSCDDGIQNGDETDVDCGGSCDPCPPADDCDGPEDCESQVCNAETGMCEPPTCDDGVQNGDETDQDCGGSCGSTCEPGEGCEVHVDCVHFVCDAAAGTCDEPSCTDGTPNGNETDVDCGGPDCPACDEPGLCEVDTDCMSSECDDGNCVPPTCADGEINGLETDVDCGGPECQPCEDAEICLEPTDCESGICMGMPPVPGVCTPATCDDGLLNGLETDVDCGGPDCDGCDNGEDCEMDSDCMSETCDPAAGECEDPTCNDGLMNGNETDVDCGGPDCLPCDGGEMCNDDADCESEVCNAGVCEDPSCTDGVMNGLETDVDCGGGVCDPCDTGEACITIFDCQSMVCLDEECQEATCDDGIQNGAETDVDCGGPDCQPCNDGEMCMAGMDCMSEVCDPAGNVCEPPTCDDGVQNGAETDVDCGGPTCDPCEDGEGCDNGLDCESGVCNELDLCEPPACDDGLQNGDETDLDCGGACGMTCDPGESCLIGGDCVSAGCDAGSLVCNDLLSVETTPTCSEFVAGPVTMQATASGGTGGPYTYAWTPDDGTLSAPNMAVTEASPAGFQSYTVTVDDGFNMAQDTALVVVPEAFDLQNNCTLLTANYGASGTGASATITYDMGGSRACELGNNEFGLHLCSDVVFEDTQLQGTVEVTNDGGDDDWVGLIWGAQDESNYYSLAWKNGAQSFFGCTTPEGVVVKRIEGPNFAALSGADFYCPADTANSTLLAAPGDSLADGWVEGQSYTITIDYTQTQSDITITRDSDGVELADFTINDAVFPSGSFGSTTLSQVNACVGPLVGACI
ncbi:MAG: hypothetical protein AAF799_31515 [Myxococcota bacterium]